MGLNMAEEMHIGIRVLGNGLYSLKSKILIYSCV